jgi:hypothetical protein
MCKYKDRGLVVGLAQLNLPSARAKNSENGWEYHDVMEVMVEWSEQEVNTS